MKKKESIGESEKSQVLFVYLSRHLVRDASGEAERCRDEAATGWRSGGGDGPSAAQGSALLQGGRRHSFSLASIALAKSLVTGFARSLACTTNDLTLKGGK